MKTKACVITAAATLLLVFSAYAAKDNSQKQAPEQPVAKPVAPPLELKTDADKISYIFGIQIGQNLKATPVEIKLDKLTRGIEDVFSGREPALSPTEIQNIMQN